MFNSSTAEEVGFVVFMGFECARMITYLLKVCYEKMISKNLSGFLKKRGYTVYKGESQLTQGQ